MRQLPAEPRYASTASEIRALRPNQVDEAVRVPGLAGDLESRPFQQSRYALAQQHIVIGQNNPHRTAGIA
jgi:hypothetical protein